MKKGSFKWLSIFGTAMILAVVMVSGFTVAADQTYTFGVENPDDLSYTMSPLPALTTQGENNFYYMYSKEHNVTGKVTVGSLKECVKSRYNNSYSMSFFQPVDADVDNYINVEWAELYPDDPKPQFWWRIDQYGTTNPAGNMSSVIGFKAPADGTYEIAAKYFGGAKLYEGEVPELADGVSFAVLRGDGTALYAENTGKTNISQEKSVSVPTQTLTMKKGEYVYFVSDPNASYEWDAAHWYIQVVQSGTAESSTPDNSSSAEPSTPSTNGGDDTSSATSGASSTPAPSTPDTSADVSTETNDTSTETSVDESESIPSVSGTEADSSYSSTGGTPGGSKLIPIIIAIIVVLVIVTGACVYVFVIRKKIVPNTPKDDTTDETKNDRS